MKSLLRQALAFAILLVNCFTAPAQQTKELRTLIIFFDGLRPDYITPEAMPNLYAFSKKAAYGKQHHSVFPTVTRVNASSFATGGYCKAHGLMGNTVFFPAVNKTQGLNTGDAENLDKINDSENGNLLTAISLGEILTKAGKKMMVFSSGSTGSALLQNHKIGNGAVISTSMIRPESLKAKVLSEVGPVPPSVKPKPNTQLNKWIADAVMRYAITLDGPLVSSVWFTDPDGTAHTFGIGSDYAMESIKVVDEQFGRILADIEQKGLTNNFNILISADHGFATFIGKTNVVDFLIKEGLKQNKDSEDVIVTEGAIYVEDKSKIKSIVSRLQSQQWVGGIYTKAAKPGSTQGIVEGTLSFETIHWNHPSRTADILVDYNWNDDKNDKGYAGTSYAKGVAGHGSMSPYEVHIALLAYGPSFKKAYESSLPTSNIDLAPTILHLHQLPIPASMNGRVFYELLNSKNAPKQPAVKVETIKTKAIYDGGSYELTLQQTILGKYRYLDFSKVTRTSK
ncbi:alkaline phosphatase family protein [Emticicia sp. 21SJ11W-3]|uniref:alkaline phosphatase family protein n=1 Tax=Emticicia sp. 21SJ11W-3 TaxID=2916755 RepID=UPI0020A1C10F|nr:alkaline phosphatase family protein [Emticicia sp. 21SJ11W-3]UTA66150.1 alkaline phosphatase family protein [Emticicia sp. 21SJ11W-3]